MAARPCPRPAGCRPQAVRAHLGCARDGPSPPGAGFRAAASLRACLGLRDARLEGEPSQVEANLGFASDLPSENRQDADVSRISRMPRPGWA